MQNEADIHAFNNADGSAFTQSKRMHYYEGSVSPIEWPISTAAVAILRLSAKSPFNMHVKTPQMLAWTTSGRGFRAKAVHPQLIMELSIAALMTISVRRETAFLGMHSMRPLTRFLKMSKVPLLLRAPQRLADMACKRAVITMTPACTRSAIAAYAPATSACGARTAEARGRTRTATGTASSVPRSETATRDERLRRCLAVHEEQCGLHDALQLLHV